MNIEQERQKYLEKELKEYIRITQMTPDERKAVTEWVRMGNSVHENGSLACYEGGRPLDFLDVYRDEEAIRKATAGMSPEDTRRYAMNYYGWDPDEPEDITPIPDVLIYDENHPFGIKEVR